MISIWTVCSGTEPWVCLSQYSAYFLYKNENFKKLPYPSTYVCNMSSYPVRMWNIQGMHFAIHFTIFWGLWTVLRKQKVWKNCLEDLGKLFQRLCLRKGGKSCCMSCAWTSSLDWKNVFFSLLVLSICFWWISFESLHRLPLSEIFTFHHWKLPYFLFCLLTHWNPE